MNFRVTLVETDRGHVRLPLPFDPRAEWGRKPRHCVRAVIAGAPFDGSVGTKGAEGWLVLSAAWRKQAGVAAGDTVEVSLEPVA